MHIIVTAKSGNVYIRAKADRSAKQVGTAYNYNNRGIIYESDYTATDTDGNEWYHIRGMGFAMAKYFTRLDDALSPETQLHNWVVGLSAEELKECIAYLQGEMEG